MEQPQALGRALSTRLQPHVREPLENLRERDRVLQTREVHTDADVRPLGEGRVQPGVPRRCRSNRVGRGRPADRGSAADRETRTSSRWTLDGNAVELDLTSRVAMIEHGSRGLEPKRLLDRVGR